jgi:hypothetical protein
VGLELGRGSHKEIMREMDLIPCKQASEKRLFAEPRNSRRSFDFLALRARSLKMTLEGLSFWFQP